MTDRDDIRVRKALQGKDFPASRSELIEYATDRDVDQQTLTALSALPAGTYGNADEAEAPTPRTNI